MVFPFLWNGSVIGSLILLAQTPPSRWSRRTLKRRARTERILKDISLPPPVLLLPDGGGRNSRGEISIPILDAPTVDWDSFDPVFDPQRGGRLRANTLRARRKQIQVEAFAHVVSEILRLDDQGRSTIVDAGSGAGNLCVALAGLLLGNDVKICAMDVNEVALEYLSSRMDTVRNQDDGDRIIARPRITTMCTDLANASLPHGTAVVVSLHACGAATDMAIRLATTHQVAFAVSPCCTAKSVVARTPSRYGPSASKERSAAPSYIYYPRSQWLRCNFERMAREGVSLSPAEIYEIVAKTADIGLGPQTSMDQRHHQKKAKMIVEYDRLSQVTEACDYEVRLLRLRDHGDYGKSELLLGAPRNSAAALAISALKTCSRFDDKKE